MFDDVREDVWHHAKKMWQERLVSGSSGNVSRRADNAHIAITPTSIPYDVLTVDDIVVVELATGTAVDGPHAPSYELPMHLVVYRSMPNVKAIVHTHAPHITALSVLRRPLPPILDEMLVHLGGTVEVADYAFTGTDAVGLNVVRALGDRSGVILASHGNVCVGKTLAQALHVAISMEAGAQIYLEALRAGDPVLLPPEAIAAGRRMHEERK